MTLEHGTVQLPSAWSNIRIRPHRVHIQHMDSLWARFILLVIMHRKCVVVEWCTPLLALLENFLPWIAMPIDDEYNPVEK